MTNYYLVLGGHAGMDDLQLRELYRMAARQHHPDRGGDPAQFTAVTAAYAAVRTAKARAGLAALYGLAAPVCGSCGGCGYAQRQQGFTGVVRTVCGGCGGCGYSLEAAASPRSYRKSKKRE